MKFEINELPETAIGYRVVRSLNQQAIDDQLEDLVMVMPEFIFNPVAEDDFVLAKSKAWTANFNNQAIAYSLWGWLGIEGIPDQYLMLNQLWVHEKYRNLGIARALIAHRLKETKVIFVDAPTPAMRNLIAKQFTEQTVYGRYDNFAWSPENSVQLLRQARLITILQFKFKKVVY